MLTQRSQDVAQRQGSGAAAALVARSRAPPPRPRRLLIAAVCGWRLRALLSATCMAVIGESLQASGAIAPQLAVQEGVACARGALCFLRGRLGFQASAPRTRLPECPFTADHCRQLVRSRLAVPVMHSFEYVSIGLSHLLQRRRPPPAPPAAGRRCPTPAAGAAASPPLLHAPPQLLPQQPSAPCTQQSCGQSCCDGWLSNWVQLLLFLHIGANRDCVK